MSALRLCIALLALVLAGVPVTASAQLEEEAARQIALAQKDLDDGNFERAVNSASSALRLNPLLYEALVIKGLAYEKLNETMLAYSLLVTYEEMSRGMVANPAVAPALERLRKLIGAVASEITAQAAPTAAPEEDSADVVARFEIISRRNQQDLYRDLNGLLAAGPAYARFRSQSRSKGDDFTFGLASIRWDGGEADIDDPAFTLILDSEKLVMKARSGASLEFGDRQAEHDVQIWFDGDRVAVRVDGAGFGPFESRSGAAGLSWFLSLEDRARAWDFEGSTWAGSLADGEIPTGANSQSEEVTELTYDRFALPAQLREKTRVGKLPAMEESLEIRVTYDMICRSKSDVIIRVADGREVRVGRDIRVRGAAKMPKMNGGFRCDGSPEPVELIFGEDGSVSGTVAGQPFPKSYPGTRRGESAEVRVRGDEALVQDLSFALGKRAATTRRFRAARPTE